MTSMRIDGDKSAKVWAKRLRNLVQSAEADGVALVAYEAPEGLLDAVLLYKDGDTMEVNFKIWSDE